ncbi:enoyl-CoA hydratase [Jatrophihabitans sp.]|uniref:enoyl-CoA hydratase n=1 Tax=Jatrophihabitans sp. TaxID=1932789 RepID=UPI0030C7608F|nr:enoyl-CoA hydratase [Jatrophihabitans sp.]
MTDYRFITYEQLDEGRIARITLNRPRYRNAQNRTLLVELTDAFLEAEHDDDVRVVILAGAGTAFSSGHDMGTPDRAAERAPGPDMHPSFIGDGNSREGAEKRMLGEWHHFFQNTLRWRNLRKITVASMQGQTFAAGLMLAWACDLIVASDDAEFIDPVGVRLGMCGVEYFAHPWEFGTRRAKELLLTGESVSVEEAFQRGMVSKIYPRDELVDRTLEYARQIAQRPTMTALLIKEAVNQTQDNQGFYNALHASFTLHQLNHAHWAEIHEDKAPRASVADGAIAPSGMKSPPPAVTGPAH